MVDRDVLSTRLNALEGYLADLRPFARRSRDEFVREPGLHHLAERLLHLACECVIDIAHHIIADEGYRQPSAYRDAIAVLAEEGVVDDALADRVAAWVGFATCWPMPISTSTTAVRTIPSRAISATWQTSPKRSRSCCRIRSLGVMRDVRNTCPKQSAVVGSGSRGAPLRAAGPGKRPAIRAGLAVRRGHAALGERVRCSGEVS